MGAGFHPDLSGRENVYLNGAILGMTREQIDARFDEIVAFSEIEDFIDTDVKYYSSGMFLRLAFSVAVHTEPDIFLVDEILSVGDEPFQRKCLERIRELQKAGRTMVVVSHELEMLEKLCTRIVVLRRGEGVFDGDPSEAIATLRAAEPARGRVRAGAAAQRPGGHALALVAPGVTRSPGRRSRRPRAERRARGAGSPSASTSRRGGCAAVPSAPGRGRPGRQGDAELVRAAPHLGEPVVHQRRQLPS